MTSSARRRGRAVIVRSASALVLGVLRWHAAREGRRRRPPDAPPRVFLGMTPIITIPTLAAAARSLGMEATSVVREVYSIHDRDVFDRLADDFVPRWLRWLPTAVRTVLGDLLVFVWALRRFDLFFFYVDGRILVRTPLREHEFDLLHRAGKHVIVTCYGGDVQTLDRIVEPAFRDRLEADYPSVAGRADQVRALRAAAEQSADVLVAGVEWVDYLDSWTHLIAAPYFLDPSQWTQPAIERAPDDPIVVFHAANHRRIKGTDLLEAAVGALQARGVPVVLDVVAGVTHEEVRARMARADIVADQFVIGWYGLQAVEGMSLGKPVVAYLRPDLVALYSEHSFAAACPIVPTAASEIEQTLEALVNDAMRRRELGAAGRRYVEDFHSLQHAAVELERWIAAARGGPQPRLRGATALDR